MEDKINNKTEDKKSLKKGSLVAPIMRTFRGDITKKLGNSAQKVVDKLIPSSALAQQSQDEYTDKEVPTKQIKKEDNTKPDSLLHTYRGDVQDLVKRKKLSLMRMASSEMDRKDTSKYELGKSGKSHHSNNAPFALLAFVMIGIFALVGAYYMYVLRDQARTQLPTQYSSLIFTESIETVDTTGKSPRSLKQDLARIRDSGYYSFGSVVGLLLVKQQKNVENLDMETTPLTSGEFLNALDVTLPERFINVFHKKFMLGFYSTQENIPFLILQTNLYDYAFEGMLTWEGAIEQDLAPLFSPGGKYTEPVFSGDSSFVDTVMNNLDVRVLRDNEKTVRILYSFVNKNTLLITTDVQAFVELSGRLRVAQ